MVNGMGQWLFEKMDIAVHPLLPGIFNSLLFVR
jgi:hypothetical protein